MKYIPYADHGGVGTREILTMIASQPSGGRGIMVDEMRRRIRILDAIDAQADSAGLTLEDADHALLRGLVEAWPFGAASRPLLAFVDSVLQAGPPPAAGAPLAPRRRHT